MINILNHNISYKHSKFSARPAHVLNSRLCVSKGYNIVLDSLVNGLMSKDVTPNHQNPAAGPISEVFHTSKQEGQKPNNIFFKYQSKELLCWRFDLTFFNLQGFFYSILKALHTCWTFAKNNKTIVFVSTDSPSDTGASAATDMLTQRFARDFLPRTHNVAKMPIPKAPALVKHHPALKSQKGRRASAPAVSRRDANHEQGQITREMTQQKQFRLPLSELKNLVHISGVFKRQLNTQNVDVSSNVTNPVIHQLEGLIYKAASRRLTASFSRMHVSFFSNSKNSFREKFTHLNSNELFSKSNQPTQGLAALKLYPLDLNKSCLVKPTVAKFSHGLGRKAWFKRARIGDQIFSSLSDNTFNTKFKKPFVNVNAHRGKRGMGQPQQKCQKLFCYDLIPALAEQAPAPEQPTLKQSALKRPASKQPASKQLETQQPTAQQPDVLSHQGLALGGIPAPGPCAQTHPHDFCNRYRALSNPVIGRKSSGKNRPRPNVDKKFKSGIRNFAPARKKGNRYGRSSYRSYDIHGMFTRAQASNAAKRFANNPYLQHADLVFFVNPDKNPGLAEQVKKLSIPSIGIVSGLKSTSYRKQPHQSNLHNSVTYPIVGNPDNLVFVMMVIRVFAKLIQRVHHIIPNRQNLAQRSIHDHGYPGPGSGRVPATRFLDSTRPDPGISTRKLI